MKVTIYPKVEKAGEILDSNSKPYHAPIIFKGFELIKEVADAPGKLGMMDLVRISGYNKSTVYGIVQAFLELGVLRQDDKNRKLRLGPLFIDYANRSLSGLNLRAISRPFLRELCHTFGGTVILGAVVDDGITIIEAFEDRSEMKISAPVGMKLSVFTGAVGKVVLAYLEKTTVKRLLEEEQLPRFTGKSIVDKTEFLTELKRVREQEYATDYEEYINGVNAVSVPLFDHQGAVFAAIWIVGFTSLLNEKKMMSAIEAMKKVSKEIQEIISAN